MEILINHWHCIMPVIAILAVMFVMRNKDKISSKKEKTDEKNQDEEKNYD